MSPSRPAGPRPRPEVGRGTEVVRGPLAGILVADCSTVLAGPFCTMLLADLGADVVKVEPPEGDVTRTWGPPWVGDAAAGTRTAAYYLSVNRNKRSIRLDLKQDDGREVLRRLLSTADVVVENHRVGGFARLGFGDDVLSSLNPDLVHLSISGFGPTGPDASKPGYDFIAQAVGGLMSITGDADADGGRPVKVGVAISDVVTGLFAAVSILAALLVRELRDGVDTEATSAPAGAIPGASAAGTPAAPPAGSPAATPETSRAAPTSSGAGAGPRPRGQRIDVSLLESTLAILVNQAQNAFVTGRAPGRLGTAHPNIVPYETFVTADGELALAVASERQWPRLCEVLGLPGLAADPRFATNGARVTNRAALRPLLAARFLTAPTARWLAELDRAAIPAGAINDVAAAFATPQAGAREMAVDLEHPVLGTIRQVGLPFDLAATPASIRTPPPLLGEHTREILTDLGYSGAEIDALARRRVT